jgi:putative hemolysin
MMILLLCVAAGVFIAGCTQQAGPAQPPAAHQTPAATAGMANPASVNCAKTGGMTEIKKDATGGEYGMCTFANGTSCEEWALFRGEGCKAGGQAPAK